MLQNSCLWLYQPRKDYLKVISWMGKVITHKPLKIFEIAIVFEEAWKYVLIVLSNILLIISHLWIIFSQLAQRILWQITECFVTLSDRTFYYTIFKKFWHLREVPGNINQVGWVKPNTQKCGSSSCWSFSPKMRQCGYQS